MPLPVQHTNMAQEGIGKLIPYFQKPVISAFLGCMLDQFSQFENAMLNPTTGYLFLVQLANAGTDTLNKYGKIVNYPRGALDNNDYRTFIGIKIMVDGSDGSFPTLIEILNVACSGPIVVSNLDNWGYNAALDLQGGYVALPLAYIGLLPAARNEGVYTMFRYWTWTDTPVFAWGDSTSTVSFTGPATIDTFFGDSVSGSPGVGFASCAIV